MEENNDSSEPIFVLVLVFPTHKVILKVVVPSYLCLNLIPVAFDKVREVRVLCFYAVLTNIGMFGTLECLCGVVDGMENIWYASGHDNMCESI